MTATAAALAEQFGVAIATGVPLYLPAIKKLALAEFIALGESLDNGKKDEAYAVVAAQMTLAELAAEKEALAALAALRATGRAEAIALADEIGLGMLKAAFAVLLSAGFL